MMSIYLRIITPFLFALVVFLFWPKTSYAAQTRDVVISEVAWMGTMASTSDEWLELYNNTDNAIDLSGWGIYEDSGATLVEELTGMISPRSYYLIERTDENTISDIVASQTPSSWGGSGLDDDGENLQLKDNSGNIIDTVNSDGGVWPAGTGGSGVPLRASMERIDFLAPDTDANWMTNDGIIRTGLDVNGSLINGTPKAQNSQGYQPTPTPTPTPSSTPTPTANLTPTSTPRPTPTPKPPTPTPTKKLTPASTPKPTSSGQSQELSLTASPTSSPSPPGEILGEEKEATDSGEATSSVESLTNFQSTPAGSPTRSPLFLILGGISLLAGGTILAWRKRKHLFSDFGSP